MIGIYIPGMGMPTSCEDCPMAFAVNFGILCTPTKRIVGDGEISKKQGFCPLVPVPEHGRLIDADEFFKALTMDDCVSILEAMHVQSILSDAPTIIPASGGKENE